MDKFVQENKLEKVRFQKEMEEHWPDCPTVGEPVRICVDRPDHDGGNLKSHGKVGRVEDVSHGGLGTSFTVRLTDGSEFSVFTDFETLIIITEEEYEVACLIEG